jgi:L-fucose mutarotase
MLKAACIHPEIIEALAKCGHVDKVLIADGNYPIDLNTGEKTKLVYLNLSHGIPMVTEVLNVINSTIAIEKAEVMMPDYYSFSDFVYSVHFEY